jgi:serine/threonine protein kinase
LPFYAMDYVEGKNLADLLAQSGPLPIETVLDIFMQVCDGVECAHHSGILHRDLKPANIMVLDAKAGHRLAKVLDFGLAKLISHDRNKQSLTAIGDVFGSPFYMSPEQCKGDKLDRRSDIYSIGCTIFECLTGQPPFTGHLAAAVIFSQLESDPPSLESVVGKGRFPASMEIVMAKLLRKNPVERYQTLLELRCDLEKVVHGKEVQPFYVSRSKLSQEGAGAHREKTAKSDAEKALRHKQLWLVIKVAAAVLIAGVLISSTASVLYRFFLPPENLPAPKDYPVEDTPKEVRMLLETPNSSRPAQPASSKDSTPYSKLVEENGTKWRVFDFPDDITIGTIYSANHVSGVAAKGRLRIPLDDQVEFKPALIVLKFPNYIKRFREGEIFGLRIAHDLSLENLESQDLSNLECLKTTSIDYLKAASVVPGIQAISILSATDRLSTADLSELKKFTSLKEVTISDRQLNASMFSKLSTIGQLESIDIRAGGEMTPILKALRNSTHLKKLSLRAAHISLHDLAIISSLPNLQILSFKSVSPSNTDTTIKALSLLNRAPKLEVLSILNLPISLDAVTALRSFKSLRLLKFDPNTSGASRTVLIQLTKALPAIRFSPSENNFSL